MKRSRGESTPLTSDRNCTQMLPHCRGQGSQSAGKPDFRCDNQDRWERVSFYLHLETRSSSCVRPSGSEQVHAVADWVMWLTQYLLLLLPAGVAVWTVNTPVWHEVWIFHAENFQPLMSRCTFRSCFQFFIHSCLVFHMAPMTAWRPAPRRLRCDSRGCKSH